MKTINNLPCYEARVDDDNTGMLLVSLVEDPAVDVDFLAFEKQEPLCFRIENEEEHKVLGVVMRPNYPMYRRNGEAEYYIQYSPETIHQMAERFFKNMNVNNVDTDHSFELVDGVVLSQAFFINRAKGIDPKGFEDLPDDTLMFEYHLTSDELWQGVKDGTWKGFSLAGTFNIVPIEAKKENVLDSIEDLLTKITNKLK